MGTHVRERDTGGSGEVGLDDRERGLHDVNGEHLRPWNTTERDGNRVLSWVAVFHAGRAIRRVVVQPLMVVSRQPVMMLRMVVIAVRVRVQCRRADREGHKRHGHQATRQATHRGESMERIRPRQTCRPGCGSQSP